MVFPSREGCTSGADISVAVRGAADGSCGPGVVTCVRAWEEAVEEPDAMASVVTVCALGAAKRAPLVGGSMVGTSVRSAWGLFVRRFRSAVGDIYRRCRPLCSVGLLSSPASRATCCPAEGGVGLWCWAFADLLVLCGGCGVRVELCPVDPSGVRWWS